MGVPQRPEHDWLGLARDGNDQNQDISAGPEGRLDVPVGHSLRLARFLGVRAREDDPVGENFGMEVGESEVSRLAAKDAQEQNWFDVPNELW